jgi:hypothetical protein
MRTLAIAGIQGGRGLIQTGREWSLMKEDTSMEGIAGCALWLLSDLGRSTTGEVIHVDAGFHGRYRYVGRLDPIYRPSRKTRPHPHIQLQPDPVARF